MNEKLRAISWFTNKRFIAYILGLAYPFGPSILGVVPVAIIACKPEIEPQPITIKINDSTGPPITGPATGNKIGQRWRLYGWMHKDNAYDYHQDRTDLEIGGN